MAKKYLYAGEDEHHLKVQHPDGSTFSIAKNAVGKMLHKHIKDLEPVKMADGGEAIDKYLNEESSSMPNPDPSMTDSSSNENVPNYAQTQPTSQAPLDIVPAETQPGAQQPLVIEPAPEEMGDRQPSSAPIMPQMPAQQAPMQQKQSVNPMEDAYANAFAQKESGITQMANAQSQAAKSQAMAYELQAKQIAKQIETYQQEHAKLDAEHKQLTDAVMNQKVDPNRLWHNAGTGSKVMAGIGVVLSGIGAGMLHQGGNLGLEAIQKATDRDIDSQKMDLGKKQTLLSDNLRRYGDLNMATQATQLQMNALTQAKVQQIAAQSGSATAQAQAKMLLGNLGLDAAQRKQQMAMMQAQAKNLGVGGSEGGTPVGQEPYQMLADPKYQAKRVIVNGRAYQHSGAGPDAQNYRNVESVAGGITDLVKQLGDLGPSATIPGTEENNKAQAIRYQLSTEIPKLKSMQIGAKRVNETEAERAEHMVSDPTSFKQLMNGGIRNDIFFKTLEDELERSRQDNLIGYRGKAQYKFKPGK